MVSVLFFLALINKEPIIADGRQNLTAASNIVNYSVFSCQSPSVSDMEREPAWPALTAGVILLTSLQNSGVEELSSIHANIFKGINVTIYSLMVGIVAGYLYIYSQKPLLSLAALILSLFVIDTTPRLINNFNNEALATILVLLASILLLNTLKYASRRSALAFGCTYGFLTLTKAQFLYIALVPIIAIFFASKRQTIFAVLGFILIVSPWMVRNHVLFGKLAISERGKTVAAIRLVMTSESTPGERDCMAFAFSHPRLRPWIGKLLEVNYQDFDRNGHCLKFNRELCFDMGTEKVKCTPFPEDLAQGTYDKKIQYFYRGTAAGQAIEADLLKFLDITRIDLHLLSNYLETLPLFLWRGMGFTGHPLLSIGITISLFMLIFTPLWPFAVLAIASHIFHIFLTHNLPRYHSIELGVMIFAATYWLDKVQYFLWHLLRDNKMNHHIIS